MTEIKAICADIEFSSMTYWALSDHLKLRQSSYGAAPTEGVQNQLIFLAASSS